MNRGVRFEPIRLGGQYSGESAMLGLVKDHLVVVLVPVEDETIPAEKRGWFMEVGFGPCRGEGRMFPTLEAASDWISRQLPHNWPLEVELA